MRGYAVCEGFAVWLVDLVREWVAVDGFGLFVVVDDGDEFFDGKVFMLLEIVIKCGWDVGFVLLVVV